MAVSDPDSSQGPLAEFAALRSEREMRYQRQHQYHTLYLTATAVIFSFALTRRELVGLLLVVPVIAYVLLGRMTAQHFADLQIGTYIANELSPRVPGGLAWEDWTRRHTRPGRWLNWLLPLLLTFPGGGTVALAWTYRYVFTDASSIGRTGLIALWLLDAVAVGACCYLIYRQRRPHEAQIHSYGGQSPDEVSDSDMAVPLGNRSVLRPR